MKSILTNIIRSRLFQHFLFWVLSYKVLLNMFSSSSEIQKIDFIYTGVFLFSLAIPVYINLALLMPYKLTFKKYFSYSFFLISLIALFSLLNIFIFNTLIDFVFPGYYFISYYDFADIIKFFIVFIALTSLLKLSKSWFVLNETNKRLREIEKDKITAELQSLKSQINPHFLFNSLNNIHSLVILKSGKAPDAIIKLGDILRYVIYRATSEYVEITEESELIRDYIELQKIRSGENAEITFQTEGLCDDIHIPPLLFLPLIENGFKHGIKSETGNSYLKIYLGCKGKLINFKMENNKGSKVNNVEKDEYKGIGLDNVKRRLSLLYPDRHKISIIENEMEYKIELEINTYK